MTRTINAGATPDAYAVMTDNNMASLHILRGRITYGLLFSWAGAWALGGECLMDSNLVAPRIGRPGTDRPPSSSYSTGLATCEIRSSVFETLWMHMGLLSCG